MLNYNTAKVQFFPHLCVFLYSVLKSKRIHRGEVLQNAVRNSDLSITPVTKRAGYSRGSYYHHISLPDLPYEIIDKYGKAIGHDFTEDFPEMIRSMNIAEPQVPYTSPAQLKRALEECREKYMRLLEKYNELLEERRRR